MLIKVGEIWSEIYAELKKENIKPVTPDHEALQVIMEAFENVGKMVISRQTEMLESQQYQELQEEEESYAKVSKEAACEGEPFFKRNKLPFL